ncbi:MAG: LAGLIDADG family homing endonuclease, partial [Nanoarchaeota archaeon]
LDKKPLILNKRALQNNYTPSEIPHRDEQIKQIAGILAPSLRMEKPSNLFIYGKTGCISGESLVYTDKGYVKIKDINNNFRVLTFDTITKGYEWSEFAFLRFQNKDILLKIRLDNGLYLIVTKDHPLLCSDMNWKKADELSTKEEIVIGYDLPHLNENQIPLAMARLLGFIISDGSMNRRQRRTKDSRGNWYNSDRQRLRYFSDDIILLNKVKEDINSLFDYTPNIVKDKNRCPAVQVISQEICQSLFNYGVPFGFKSSIVEIPEIVFQSSTIVQREFLKALFTGDGTVSTHTYQIEYYSNSEKLLQEISYLLHQEGIICKIKPKMARLNNKIFNSYRLYIQGQENLLKFYHKIGFYSKKQEKLKELLNKYKKNMGVNQNNYTLSKIIGIEEVYEPYVYDLVVPKNHNFIANGIISHNTGKTVVTKYVTEQIISASKEKKIPLKIFYLNCKMKRVADTEYRIISQLAKAFGEEVPA